MWLILSPAKEDEQMLALCGVLFADRRSVEGLRFARTLRDFTHGRGKSLSEHSDIRHKCRFRSYFALLFHLKFCSSLAIKKLFVLLSTIVCSVLFAFLSLLVRS